MEARLYEKLEHNRVKCQLCSHRCAIDPGGLGICGVRENRDGTLHSLVYGKVIAENCDPIEKKPLYHVAPGSLSYSIATVGCNLRCAWCQNSDISAMPRDQHVIQGRDRKPEHIVSGALKTGCESIAYTYTEPTIFFEYAYDISYLAKEQGLLNVLVTNGFMTPEMLRLCHPFMDAANVDLKAFREDTYRKYAGARLQPVLDSMTLMKELGIWVEVTTLVIPDLNDGEGELRDIARFIHSELGPETPWHISRFHPCYNMCDRGPTRLDSIERACRIGREEGLRYIYMGNVGGQGQDTVCHQCGAVLIQRRGFSPSSISLENGVCPECRTPVAGVRMG